jgi:hypothetical protein
MNRLLLHPKVFAPVYETGSIHFESYRVPRKMDTALEEGGHKNVPTQKKKWCTPSFEIISRDVVQGGTAPGAEGTAYFS